MVSPFRYLKLELLSQFPASNKKKYVYLWKIDICKIDLIDWQSVSVIFFGCKLAWNGTAPAAQGLNSISVQP